MDRRINRWGSVPLPLFLVFLTGFLLLSSCKTQRSIIKQPLKEEGAEYLFSKLKEHELQYTWFNARFSAEYQNAKQKQSFSGQIRIKKDTLIWLSLSVMGLEGMRLMITQDSIKYINRLNSTYLIGDWYDLNKFLNTNIEYDILQSFLIGNDISFYEDGKFKASVDKDEYKLSTASRRKIKKYVRKHEDESNILIQNIWLDPVTFKITRADVKEIRRDNIKLDATYSSFEMIGVQLFPRDMIYQISAENKILVDVSFSRINIDEPMQFPFKIPGSFTRVRP
ncbi:MAG: DUF4292 domain-containing protein [Bacteroidetes bacterium]|nr:MAG: DUF4292 domain-containing protein [Bacteroidota bacterium]